MRITISAFDIQPNILNDGIHSVDYIVTCAYTATKPGDPVQTAADFELHILDRHRHFLFQTSAGSMQKVQFQEMLSQGPQTIIRRIITSADRKGNVRPFRKMVATKGRLQSGNYDISFSFLQMP